MSSQLFLADMSSWWNGLDWPTQTYFLISLVAGIIAMFLTFGGLIGIDSLDDPSDFSMGHTDAEAFSIRAINGFFLGFGLIGFACEVSGFGHLVSAISALVAGFTMMGLILVIIRIFKKLKSDGTMRIDETVGAAGTVYVTIPPAGAAGGQVNVTFSNRLETFPAVQRGYQPIAGGARIRVVAVDNGTLVVENA